MIAYFLKNSLFITGAGNQHGNQNTGFFARPQSVVMRQGVNPTITLSNKFLSSETTRR